MRSQSLSLLQPGTQAKTPGVVSQISPERHWSLSRQPSVQTSFPSVARASQISSLAQSLSAPQGGRGVHFWVADSQ